MVSSLHREPNRHANAAKHRHAKKDVWELEWLDLTLERRAVSDGGGVACAVWCCWGLVGNLELEWELGCEIVKLHADVVRKYFHYTL